MKLIHELLGVSPWEATRCHRKPRDATASREATGGNGKHGRPQEATGGHVKLLEATGSHGRPREAAEAMGMQQATNATGGAREVMEAHSKFPVWAPP